MKIAMEEAYEPTEPSSKNSSNFNTMKQSGKRFSTPKTQLIKSQKSVKESSSVSNGSGLIRKDKQFLANTNGLEMTNRNRRLEK